MFGHPAYFERALDAAVFWLKKIGLGFCGNYFNVAGDFIDHRLCLARECLGGGVIFALFGLGQLCFGVKFLYLEIKQK